MSKWLDRAKLKISESADRGTANTDVRTLSAVTAVPQSPESENFESSNGSNGSAPTGHFQNFAYPDSAPALPSPWNEIRRWIQRGWRAEFGPPGPDGRQSITWIPPGQWEPVQPDVQSQADESVVESARTDGTMQRPLQAVRCGDCAHFRPDTIGDGSGIGSCGAGVPARAGWPARYPNAERHCRDFTASTSTSEAAP